jgi:hypothetical protein
MKILYLIVFLSHIFAANIHFNPIVKLAYYSEGSDSFNESTPISIFGAGLNVNYHKDNVFIDATFVNHRLWGISTRMKHNYNAFNHQQALSWGQDPTRSGDSFDYDYSNFIFKYVLSNIEIFIGKQNPQWGNGYSKLIISDKSPSFPLFGFNWDIFSNLKVDYFHGSLVSKMNDELYEDIYIDGNNIVKSPHLSRSIAAHRFVWSPFENLTLIGSESVIYGVRGIDFHYLMPFIPFWSLQHYLGDTDNIQMSGEIIYSPIKNIQIYGTVFMDEWAPDKTFEKNNRNWFAYQCGMNWENPINHSHLTVEYTWTDSRIYKHRFEINEYYSHGSPIGFWAGPHAEELLLIFQKDFNENNLGILFSHAKRGVFTDLVDQYTTQTVERYNGITEEKLFTSIFLNYRIFNNIKISPSIDYIHWENAGFEPSKNIDEQQLLKKTGVSLNIELSYNLN